MHDRTTPRRELPGQCNRHGVWTDPIPDECESAVEAGRYRVALEIGREILPPLELGLPDAVGDPVLRADERELADVLADE